MRILFSVVRCALVTDLKFIKFVISGERSQTYMYKISCAVLRKLEIHFLSPNSIKFEHFFPFLKYWGSSLLTSDNKNNGWICKIQDWCKYIHMYVCLVIGKNCVFQIQNVTKQKCKFLTGKTKFSPRIICDHACRSLHVEISLALKGGCAYCLFWYEDLTF